METFRERLLRWGQSRCEVVEVASLFARCPIAHKWKAPIGVAMWLFGGLSALVRSLSNGWRSGGRQAQ
jgi:hypothetical protein